MSNIGPHLAAGNTRPPQGSRRVQAAIVGGGWMGQLHAQCLVGTGEVDVVGVVDPAPSSLAAFTAEVPGATGYATVATMLRESDASLVAVCTPSGLHAEQAIECLHAGRHVVVEKPIATTVADGEAMVQAARDASVTLSVIMQYRFNRDALRLKRAVEHGLFGDILFANVINYISRDEEYFATNGGWRGTWALNGGGVLINQTTHGMDLLNWCMGPIDHSSGIAATRRHPIEVEDTIDAVFGFPGGAIGHVQATTAASGNSPLRLEIIGTKGSATFERARLSYWQPASDLDLLSEQEQRLLPEAPEHAYGEPFGIAHHRQYAAILEALNSGTQPPVPGEEAIVSLRTIAEIYAAVTGPTSKPDWVTGSTSVAV